jgi:hypothetical protein
VAMPGNAVDIAPDIPGRGDGCWVEWVSPREGFARCDRPVRGCPLRSRPVALRAEERQAGVSHAGRLALARAGVPTNYRSRFPEHLGDGDTEALSKRLLHHNVGNALERVHLHGADPGQVREQVNIGLIRGRFAHTIVEGQPSGSSSAIDPTSASCSPGPCARASLHPGTTPRGSFHGSNRETWTAKGRARSMPCLPTISQARLRGKDRLQHPSAPRLATQNDRPEGPVADFVKRDPDRNPIVRPP